MKNRNPAEDLTAVQINVVAYLENTPNIIQLHGKDSLGHIALTSFKKGGAL